MKYDVLRASFPAELVRSRPGQHGKTLSYIPTFAVIERLNAGCDQWDFLVDEYKLLDAEVVVLGRLVADGVTKSAFGGSNITFDKEGQPASLGDDLKAASSDALKKAASLLGVGLELLSGKPAAVPTPKERVPEAGRKVEVTEGATVRQIAAIHSASRRCGLDQKGLTDFVSAQVGKAEVSLLSRQEASRLIDALNAAGPGGVSH